MKNLSFTASNKLFNKIRVTIDIIIIIIRISIFITNPCTVVKHTSIFTLSVGIYNVPTYLSIQEIKRRVGVNMACLGARTGLRRMWKQDLQGPVHVD